jgi:precorrin-3B synthase
MVTRKRDTAGRPTVGCFCYGAEREDKGQMHEARAGAVRGSCPSVHRPFAAADGGLARIRLPGGALTAGQAAAIAEAAERHGGGTVEITSRANLQLRGVAGGRTAPLGRALAASGLLAPSVAAEDHRNVMASPTAGFDRAELLDVSPHIGEIVDRISAAGDLGPLSAKFGVLVDGGGEVGLRGRTQDLGLIALAVPAGPVRLAVRFGLFLAEPLPRQPSFVDELVLVPPEVASDVVVAAMELCAASGRMSELTGRLGRRRVLELLEAWLGTRFERLPGPDALPWPARVRLPPLGSRPERRRGRAYVDAVPALGRLDAAALAGLAGAASEHGDGRLRLTPWRTVLVPGVPEPAMPVLAARLGELGLCCDPDDPVGSVVACAGSRGCTAGRADTQADGARLIELLREARGAAGTVHLSGCAKGCAGVRAGDVTLVGTEAGRYDVFVQGEDVPGFGRLVASEQGADAALRGAADLAGGSEP